MKSKSVLLSLVLLGLACGSALAQHAEVKKLTNGHPLQCTPSSAESSQNQAVFQQLNQYRQANGLNTLAYDAALEGCIEGHCHHMSMHPFFAHQGPEPDAADPWTRASGCGTTAQGENIARGQNSATAVMDAWKKSPGHDANMRNGNWTRVGVGYYAAGGPYWGQIFGTGGVTTPPASTPPPATQPPPAGGGGGTPPAGGTTPPAGGTTPPAGGGLSPSPAGPTSDPYPTNAPPTTSSIKQAPPVEKKIVPAGMLKPK